MTSIGTDSANGKMSPHNMLTTTFSDELKLFNNGKVIGISLKDRGAILPAGHSADAAYWMDSNGKWISSSYYMNDLPDWIKEENNKNNIAKYMSGIWKVKNEFTHNLDTLLKVNGNGAIKSTPFGNSILNDLAIRILKEEKLGKNKTTDCLFISYSSTDYIGHQYGPHAPELVDTYMKLDKDIAQLLKSIDSKVGFENVVLFLTADHGVVSEPKELLERNIPAGYFESTVMIDGLKLHLNTTFGEGEWVKNYSNNQLFLNHNLIVKKGLELGDIQQICADFLLNIEGVKNTFTAKQMHDNEYQNSFHSLIQRGYNQKRSGDVMVALQTGWISKYWENGGTTHGSSYSYDTHVPLIFWGGKIKQGTTDRKVNIRDIAPSISTILGTAYPNGCTGNPLVEITK
jgi:predicted AlkP superfamily pyrophosphatase or phosphodiesterase